MRGEVVSIVERLAALPGLQVKIQKELQVKLKKSKKDFRSSQTQKRTKNLDLANTNTQIQKYEHTRLLADDWHDNQRGDFGSTLARSQEGWAHPSQHQPRHIGEQLH